MIMKFIPEDTLTQVHKDFIGVKFTTRGGGIFEIVGVVGKRRSTVIYAGTCTLCSNDREMYKEGLFTVVKADVIAGYFSCGCGGITGMNTRQRLLSIERHLLKRDPSTKVVCEFKSRLGIHEYILTCDVCSLDEELFPLGSIVAKRQSILECRKSCGCSHPRWTKNQCEILVKRQCTFLGYTFKGWEGSFKGVLSKVRLENKTKGYCWSSTSMSSLMSKKSVPLKSRGNSKSKARIGFPRFCERYPELASQVTEDFENPLCVYYKCETCSLDKFCKAGLCEGVFRVYKETLKRGGRPCRCSKPYYYTKPQQELRVREAITSLGGRVLGWEDDSIFTVDHGKVVWVCCNGHSNITLLNNVLVGGGCNSCRKTAGGYNGYYKDRVEEQDYLYFINFNNQYLKDGRSFHIKRRLTELATAAKLPLPTLKVLRVFTGTHQEVFDTEQEIHAELRERGFSCDEVKWSNELFTMDSEYYTNQLLDGIGLTEVDVSTLL